MKNKKQRKRRRKNHNKGNPLKKRRTVDFPYFSVLMKKKKQENHFQSIVKVSQKDSVRILLF